MAVWALRKRDWCCRRSACLEKNLDGCPTTADSGRGASVACYLTLSSAEEAVSATGLGEDSVSVILTSSSVAAL